MTSSPLWWQTTTIYQIYPRSFSDSNNDGIGDLHGILSRLDYIKDLGFDTIWISPFFCSPQQDFGYDISGYTDIAPEYGTLADVEALVQGVHDRGMKILFDLVLNHTSIQHPWFKQSRKSRDNPKRDWYIWRDGRGKRPPNNWSAITGGSGWHYDPLTDQFYYASFLPFQPDLNWRNPAVKDAMFEGIRFWLDKGVDGFRLDIFHVIYKDEYFRDNPLSWHLIPNEDRFGFFQEWVHTLNQPEVFELAKELRALLDGYSPARMLVGEVFGKDDILKKFLGEDQDGLNLIFLWDLLNLKPDAAVLRKVIRHYEKHYPPPQLPVYVFGNHDQKRVISHLRDDPQVAKLLAVFQFTVRGVPVTYYGEEIGMSGGDFPLRKALDPIGQRFKFIPKFLLDLLGLYVNRDGCRTPMQWDGSPNAGFCGQQMKPWLPVNPNYKSRNVESQEQDDASLLSTYKKMLKLRRDTPALRIGALQVFEGSGIHPNLLVYSRQEKGHTVLVVINFSRVHCNLTNPTACREIMLVVNMDRPNSTAALQLPPLSAILLAG